MRFEIKIDELRDAYPHLSSAELEELEGTAYVRVFLGDEIMSFSENAERGAEIRAAVLNLLRAIHPTHIPDQRTYGYHQAVAALGYFDLPQGYTYSPEGEY